MALGPEIQEIQESGLTQKVVKFFLMSIFSGRIPRGVKYPTVWGQGVKDDINILLRSPKQGVTGLFLQIDITVIFFSLFAVVPRVAGARLYSAELHRKYWLGLTNLQWFKL